MNVQKLLPVLLAPALIALLTGQDVYIGPFADWKLYESMLVEAAGSLPVVKSSDFRKSGLDLSTCMTTLVDPPPSMIYASFIDPSDPNHTLFAVARSSDKSDVQWALTTQGKNSSTIRAELHAAKTLSSSGINKIWKIVDQCAKMS